MNWSTPLPRTIDTFCILPEKSTDQFPVFINTGFRIDSFAFRFMLSLIQLVFLTIKILVFEGLCIFKKYPNLIRTL